MTGALALPPAYRLVQVETIDSTNEEAKRLARAGAEDGTLIWAREQTAGRGRSGRTWTSPPGNLYLSLVLRPECPPGRAAELGFVAAVALGAALGGLIQPLIPLTYKWPNDVLLGDRKLAGILLEAESGPAGTEALDWLILGIGVNVLSFPLDTEFPATSLKFEGETDVTVEMLLESFTRYFLEWVNRWLEDGFGAVRQAWLARAKGVGSEISVRLPNATLRGTFRDLDTDGALLLGPEETGGPVRRITAGDVFFG
jgi:BirA family biotin operon repressor/biotin-[acetyl-CoA-carboxylase] ligase